MSTKNFVSYGDAETLFTGVGNKISGKQAKPTTISYADWLLLTPQQQETGNWLVTGVPGADLSLRVLALETNKQDKTDNNLQTTSKETTGAINELKSGLIVFHGLQDITSTIEIPSNSYTATDNCILWLHANDYDGSLTSVKPYFNYYINNVKYECIGAEHQTIDLHVFLKRNDVFHFSADYPYEATLVRSVKII